MDQKVKEQFLKLKLMGFEAIEVKSKSKNSHKILFISKNNKQEVEKVLNRYPYETLELFFLASFVYDCIFNTWIKDRLGYIPKLTEVERILYGPKS